MSGNTFGKLFTLTTAGESHGEALIGIVDGCPPGMPLTEKDLQDDLDLRNLAVQGIPLRDEKQTKLRFFLALLKE